ncbi:MAG: PIN domain-containing protein [Candidatus Micrarchaeota archaeon]
MTDKVLIDSNILVYAFDISDGKKRDHANEVIRKYLENECAVISVQNIGEFCKNVCEKIPNKLSYQQAKEISQDIIYSFQVVLYTPETFLRALDLSSSFGIHFWDALIAATMQENNIKEIITENVSDFEKVPWIKAINPFK